MAKCAEPWGGDGRIGCCGEPKLAELAGKLAADDWPLGGLERGCLFAFKCSGTDLDRLLGKEGPPRGCLGEYR